MSSMSLLAVAAIAASAGPSGAHDDFAPPVGTQSGDNHPPARYGYFEEKTKGELRRELGMTGKQIRRAEKNARRLLKGFDL